MTTQDQIKQDIKDAIDHMTQDRGFQLAKYWFGDVNEKCACPLACLMLKKGKEVEPAKIFSQLDDQYKGLSSTWFFSFIDGYDGIRLSSREGIDEDAFKFGEEIYQIYKDKVKRMADENKEIKE